MMYIYITQYSFIPHPIALSHLHNINVSTPQTCVSQTPGLRTSYTLEELASSSIDDASNEPDTTSSYNTINLNPDRTQRREQKQHCISNCIANNTTNPNKTYQACRRECTNNGNSIGPGKLHTISPTPTPPSREHLFCMHKCELGGTKTMGECRKECPNDGSNSEHYFAQD